MDMRPIRGIDIAAAFYFLVPLPPIPSQSKGRLSLLNPYQTASTSSRFSPELVSHTVLRVKVRLAVEALRGLGASKISSSSSRVRPLVSTKKK